MAKFAGNDPDRIREIEHAKILYLSRYKGFAFRDLEDFTHLLELELDSTQIEDLAGIGHLKALRILTFTECRKLANLDGIEELDRLHSLDFALCNRLEEFGPVSRLGGLRRLWIEANTLPSLSFLRGLESLEDLALSVNRIEDGDTSPLKDLPSLRKFTMATRALPRGHARSLPKQLPGVEIELFTKV